MSALLALLLFLYRWWLGNRHGSGNKAAKGVADALQLRAIVEVGTLANEKVGLAQIILGETPNEILDRLKPLIDLLSGLARMLKAVTRKQIKCHVAAIAVGERSRGGVLS